MKRLLVYVQDWVSFTDYTERLPGLGESQKAAILAEQYAMKMDPDQYAHSSVADSEDPGKQTDPEEQVDLSAEFGRLDAENKKKDTKKRTSKKNSKKKR